MVPPQGSKIYEGLLCTYWFDVSGILYARLKPALRTLEQHVSDYALIRQITGHKKVCLLADSTDSSSPLTSEVSEYIVKEMPLLFIAIAVISASTVGKYIATSFISEKQEPVPLRYYADIKEAREWLMKFM